MRKQKSRLKDLARRLLLVAGAVSSTAAMTGCELTALDKKDGASMAIRQSGSGGADALGVFRDTVHAYARANCAGCHGSSQNPLFAVSNVESAYDLSKSLASFSDIPASTFVRKVKDGHCGSACGTNGSEMISLITEWAAAESASSGGGTGGGDGGGQVVTTSAFKTAPMALPSPLATGNSYSALRFNLSNVAPANSAVAGGIFEIEIQRFTTPSGANPGSYRLRKPKLATAANAVYLRNIRIYINGKASPLDNDFQDVDIVVSPQAIPSTGPLPFPVLSANEVITLQELDNDQISIGFDRLEKTTAVLCKNLPGFVSNVKPVFQARCYGCHQNTANTGYNKFNMTGSDEDQCMRSLQRVDQATPAASALVVNPKGVNGHPAVGGYSAANQDAFINWIKTE